MKHLIETANLSSLTKVNYDRIILDSTKNEIVYRGGVTYEYVDLGLPSGTLWATMNVGAETETDYGDYFMWGSTTPNTADECTWTNAPFNNGLDSYNEEYFTSHKSEWLDDKNNLKPEFDAATQIMGGDWRIPTKDEIQELFNKTTKKWTQMNSVNGCKFTSKTDTSKYIFIPAAGKYNNGSVDGVGSESYIWSYSVRTSNLSNAWNLYYYSFSNGMNSSPRYYGRPVRGVRK